jgi:hypothetical protein
MSTLIEPLITDQAQVCVVVRDLEATMKRYVELAGIGPWAVFDLGPPDVTNIVVRGKPTTFRVKLALTWTKDRMWEIIQPVEGPSPYQEFLDQHGEGVHHVLVQHAGAKFDEVIERFRKRGVEPLMTFNFRGTRFAFIDATNDLISNLEILERPGGAAPAGRPLKRPATPPAYWYPFEPPAGHTW